MISDPKELNTYPDILSKEQFCKACHISKRTALYLLDFLLTDAFNQIVRKTPEHERMLWELRKNNSKQPLF